MKNMPVIGKKKWKSFKLYDVLMLSSSAGAVEFVSPDDYHNCLHCEACGVNNLF